MTNNYTPTTDEVLSNYGLRGGGAPEEIRRWLAVYGAEVTEAATRAEIDESRPSPINGHEWRGQSDSGFSTICIHCGGWSGKVANSRCPATVTPSRDDVVSALSASPASFSGCGQEIGTEEIVIDVHDAYDAILTLLPGRSEAEVKAEALREAAAELPMDCFDPRHMADWITARADELERGGDRG